MLKNTWLRILSPRALGTQSLGTYHSVVKKTLNHKHLSHKKHLKSLIINLMHNMRWNNERALSNQCYELINTIAFFN